MSRYSDHWHDSGEPAWMIEPTTEWHPQFPGQRYAGDIGVEHAPAAPRGRSAVGRAEVPPLAPTRPDGTYIGRSWDDLPDGRPGRQDAWHGQPDGPDARRYGDESYRRPPAEQRRPDDRQWPPRQEPPHRNDRGQFDAPGRPVDSPRQRDHAGPDRYDSRTPRYEPAGRDRPVSPAGRPDPGWLPEPDEDAPPRRPAAYERPDAGYDRRPDPGHDHPPGRVHDRPVASGHDRRAETVDVRQADADGSR
jgi:hypothetical protein